MKARLSSGDRRSRAALSRSDPINRAVAMSVVMIGAGLVAFTIFSNLLAVGPALDNLIVDIRPALTQSTLDTARADIEILSAVEKEFTNKLIPALSQQTINAPGEFIEYLTRNFPSVTAGMNALPAEIHTFNGLIDILESQRPLFASVDAFPTENVTATTGQWAIFGASLVVSLLGLFMLALPKTGAVAAVLVGLLLLLAPIALSLPAKGVDADQLNANLRPIYTQTLVSDSKKAVAAIEAMGNEMQTAMLPDLATRLEMDSEEFATFIAINFPATAKALQTMPASMERFRSVVQILNTNLVNYDKVNSIGLANLVVILMGSGGMVALLGMVVILKRRRRFA